MPIEIVALIQKPLLLLLVLAAGAIPAMVLERAVQRNESRRRRERWQNRQGGRDSKPNFRSLRSVTDKAAINSDRPTPDSADQLRYVMAAEFKARALLNKPERRLLAVIDKALAENTVGWRAMGQVNLGEILWSDDKEAFWAINAKRVDLLIVDADCQPLHAIEFQGTGHHQDGNAAAARDAVKREALRRAGIGYVEVKTGDTPTQVHELIRRLASR